MRIDRLLCNLRFVRSRSLGADLARGGQLRRNGARITRPSQDILVGDILTIPIGPAIRLIEILALPERRGSARDMQSLYRSLDPNGETDIGAGQANEWKADP